MNFLEWQGLWGFGLNWYDWSVWTNRDLGRNITERANCVRLRRRCLLGWAT